MATAAESTKIPITLTDGRVAEFNAKQKLIKTSEIDDQSGIVKVQLDFRNGETRLFTMPDDLVLRFAAHGAEQKLGDAIAGYKDGELDDAVLEVDELIKRLEAGEWNATRAAGEGSKGMSVLLQALVEVTGKSIDTLKEWLGSKTQAEKLALRRTDQLAPVIQRLESEKASKSKDKIDTSSLFGELDGLGSAPATSKSKAPAEA